MGAACCVWAAAREQRQGEGQQARGGARSCHAARTRLCLRLLLSPLFPRPRAQAPRAVTQSLLGATPPGLTSPESEPGEHRGARGRVLRAYAAAPPCVCTRMRRECCWTSTLAALASGQLACRRRSNDRRSNLCFAAGSGLTRRLSLAQPTAATCFAALALLAPALCPTCVLPSTRRACRFRTDLTDDVADFTEEQLAELARWRDFYAKHKASAAGGGPRGRPHLFRGLMPCEAQHSAEQSATYAVLGMSSKHAPSRLSLLPSCSPSEGVYVRGQGGGPFFRHGRRAHRAAPAGRGGGSGGGAARAGEGGGAQRRRRGRRALQRQVEQGGRWVAGRCTRGRCQRIPPACLCPACPACPAHQPPCCCPLALGEVGCGARQQAAPRARAATAAARLPPQLHPLHSLPSIVGGWVWCDGGLLPRRVLRSDWEGGQAAERCACVEQARPSFRFLSCAFQSALPLGNACRRRRGGARARSRQGRAGGAGRGGQRRAGRAAPGGEWTPFVSMRRPTRVGSPLTSDHPCIGSTQRPSPSLRPRRCGTPCARRRNSRTPEATACLPLIWLIRRAPPPILFPGHAARAQPICTAIRRLRT